MASKRNDAKKHYIAPSFKEIDADAARAKLEATGVPEDPDVEKMWSATDEKLSDKNKIHVASNEKEHRKINSDAPLSRTLPRGTSQLKN